MVSCPRDNATRGIKTDGSSSEMGGRLALPIAKLLSELVLNKGDI